MLVAIPGIGVNYNYLSGRLGLKQIPDALQQIDDFSCQLQAFKACSEQGKVLGAGNKFIGYSFGIYAALHLAGAFDYKTGVEIISRVHSTLYRWQVLEAALDYRSVLVCGLPETLWQYVEVPGVVKVIIHGPEHFIISGAKASVRVAVRHMKEAGASCTWLYSLLPYHHHDLEMVSGLVLEQIYNLPIREPVCEVLSCIDGKVVKDPTEEICRALHTPLNLPLALKEVTEPPCCLGPKRVMSRLIELARGEKYV